MKRCYVVPSWEIGLELLQELKKQDAEESEQVQVSCGSSIATLRLVGHPIRCKVTLCFEYTSDDGSTGEWIISPVFNFRSCSDMPFDDFVNLHSHMGAWIHSLDTFFESYGISSRNLYSKEG